MKPDQHRPPAPGTKPQDAPAAPAPAKPQAVSSFPATSDVLCMFAFLWDDPKEEK